MSAPLSPTQLGVVAHRVRLDARHHRYPRPLERDRAIADVLDAAAKHELPDELRRAIDDLALAVSR